jgi:hypothetical protein
MEGLIMMKEDEFIFLMGLNEESNPKDLAKALRRALNEITLLNALREVDEECYQKLKKLAFKELELK